MAEVITPKFDTKNELLEYMIEKDIHTESGDTFTFKYNDDSTTDGKWWIERQR